MSDHPLHVAVDARSLQAAPLRGPGKSLSELVSRTAASGAIRWRLLADRPDRPLRAPAAEGVDVTIFESRLARLHAWEQWSLPRRARQLGVDLLHAQDGALPWWQPVPSVVTLPDTARWQPRDPPWAEGVYRDRLLPAAYHRASAIITVSNASRRDILARWPALKPSLHVISPGVDERYLEVQPERRPIEIGGQIVTEPYLLYVGGVEPRKRLAWALQTWRGGQARGVSLVVCGVETASHAEVRRMMPREAQDKLILAPVVSEDDMPRLYLHAAAVLYPSIGCAFGLPVIEAQAVGTPVLFSETGRLVELKGPGAVVLPVDDLAAWVRAADLLVQSRPSSHGPDRIARAWAGQYSWDASVKRTLAVYDSVRERHVSSRDPIHPKRSTVLSNGTDFRD
jgi:glycosyltransferase involved in cell wall biosynthesis